MRSATEAETKAVTGPTSRPGRLTLPQPIPIAEGAACVGRLIDLTSFGDARSVSPHEDRRLRIGSWQLLSRISQTTHLNLM